MAEALRMAAGHRLHVLPWGGGTRLPRALLQGTYDVALDLTGLDRVIEYDPEDLTLTAQCGSTLQRLAATCAARGQELPLEAPHAARATLGGTLAANASGPRRLRFGGPRDRILGARFACTDGSIARSGGKVVKNVAGFAIHRLLCGSWGGLAVILEASLKLQPAPERRVALLFGLHAHEIASPGRWTAMPRLEPAFLTVLGRAAAQGLPEPLRLDAPFVAIAGLEGDAPWVAAQEARVVEVLGTPSLRAEADEVAGIAGTLADAQDQPPPAIAFTSAHNTPAAIAPFLERPGAARLVFHAPAGRLHWSFPAGAGDSDLPPLLRQLHEAGFQPIEVAGLPGIEVPVPPEGALVPLRERIRGALDPEGWLTMGSAWGT